MKQSFTIVLVIVGASIGQPTASAARPNLILVTGDDMGFQLGCYGDAVATTPHMDRLAREGTRFTRGYITQASCSSSRSSMLTGLYPHQNGQIGLAHLGYSMRPDVPSYVPRHSVLFCASSRQRVAVLSRSATPT
jgi:N-sulfoglucosamine sulfohydrolase